MAYFKITV